MRTPRFKTRDFVKYNGNVYQIVNIVRVGNSDRFSYEVKCIRSKFNDSVVKVIGMAAEDYMELVKIDPVDCVDKACDWLKDNAGDYVVHHWNETMLDVQSLVHDFKAYMYGIDPDSVIK